MSFLSAIRQSLDQGFTATDYSVIEIMVPLGVAFLVALYIFLVYRIVTKSEFFSKEFGIAMVAMAIVTSGIILAMSSSLVISLGMVGALSIVRFRTAIKEPLDLFFLFWSIGTGIICGAGLFKIAILLAACVTLVLILLYYLPSGLSGEVMFISGDSTLDENDVLEVIKRNSKSYKVVSRSMTSDKREFVIEVKSKDSNALLKEVQGVNNTSSVSLVTHAGGR